MSTQVSAQLERAAQRASEAGREVAVIVTHRPEADRASLERAGLTIRLAYGAIPAVAGTVAAPDVERLAALEEVERIELDGEVHAL